MLHHLLYLFAIIFGASILLETGDASDFAYVMTFTFIIIVYPFIPLYYHLFKACKDL